LKGLHKRFCRQLVGHTLLSEGGNCDRSREWAVSKVLDLADSYYHILWSILTPSERLVLYQLAMDGWTNPRNIASILQLKRKLLIFRDPMYRIIAVAIGVGVWLLYMQAAFSQIVVAYIAAITTLLTAIAGLFGKSSGRANSSQAD
jgi:hypothetical protein